MTNKEFQELLKKRLSSIKAVLGQKAKEYASDGDRLHNFKMAARIKGESPAQALWGMAMKHLVSVVDLIEGNQEPTEAMVDEKIGDLVNYMILLEALFKDGQDYES